MNRISKVIMLMAVTFAGCNGEYSKTESGLEYKYINEAHGRKPVSGEVLEMNIAYQTQDGKVLYSSPTMGGPVPILYQEDKFSKNGSLEEVFLMMTEGDSIEFKVQAAKVFEETFGRDVPDSIQRDSFITFNLGLKRIISANDYRREQAVNYMSEAKAQYMLASEKINQEGARIDEYLSSKNLKARKTETGIRYIIEKEGEGENAKPGDQVAVNYVGRVLDGEIFDTSIKEVAQKNNRYNPAREPYEPYKFTLGLGQVIYGWDEGIGLLNKGAKATLYIPSPMGYGEQAASEIIKENSILVFEIELVDILKK